MLDNVCYYGQIGKAINTLAIQPVSNPQVQQAVLNSYMQAATNIDPTGEMARMWAQNHFLLKQSCGF